MKVLFCAYDRPGHIASGPNAWIQRLIPDLRDKYSLNIEMLFVYSGDLSQCPTISFFARNNLPFHTVNKDDINFVSDQVKEILKIVKEFHFSILVANLVVPAFYCARYLKKFNIPVIGVLHSNDLFYKSVIKNFIEVSNENSITHAVAVSNFLEEKAQDSNTNTICIQNIACGTPTVNSYARVSKNELSVLYAGRLEIEQKQIIKLTKSFVNASMANTRLKFTIVGSGSQEENIKKILNESKGHSVCYKGAIPPSKITYEMLNHQVFSLLSDYEGMPIALMEAMACGLVPICLNEKSGINEIIQHGINGFIVKDRDEDYRGKLNLLAEDFELWKQMSKAAIKTIEQKYASELLHEKWFELLLSFYGTKTRKIKIPRYLRLEGELLYYGDNRKPSWDTLLVNEARNKWKSFKMFVRPRTRLRSILNKK